MEFDAIEGENGVETEDVIGRGKVLVQGYKYTAVFNHCRCYLHCRNALLQLPAELPE